MRSKVGKLCMLIGTVLMAGALSLFLWNQYDNLRAEKTAKGITKQLEDAVNDTILPDPYDTEMTEVNVDGFGYIGYISVPVLNLKLPVMSEWDYERLRTAPCRYAGSDKTNDLVIAAHNYRCHFGQIKNLKLGDEVYFTDMDGVTNSYTVAELDILDPEAVEEMTCGEYDLTLFTCTYGGQSRVTVRCMRENE